MTASAALAWSNSGLARVRAATDRGSVNTGPPGSRVTCPDGTGVRDFYALDRNDVDEVLDPHEIVGIARI